MKNNPNSSRNCSLTFEVYSFRKLEQLAGVDKLSQLKERQRLEDLKLFQNMEHELLKGTLVSQDLLLDCFVESREVEIQVIDFFF